MLGVLIFYYCFSVLFMIGYVDFDELDSVWVGIAAVTCMLIVAPLVMPINLWNAMRKIYKKH